MHFGSGFTTRAFLPLILTLSHLYFSFGFSTSQPGEHLISICEAWPDTIPFSIGPLHFYQAKMLESPKKLDNFETFKTLLRTDQFCGGCFTDCNQGSTNLGDTTASKQKNKLQSIPFSSAASRELSKSLESVLIASSTRPR